MKIIKSFAGFLLILVLTFGLSVSVLSGGCEVLSIAVTEFTSDELQDGAPPGWELEDKKGTPNLSLEEMEEGQYVLHMKSVSASYGIKKDMKVKKEKYPFLNWKWKVCKLPIGGDVRNSKTDDQAIQIYIAFKETGWPAKLKTPVIGYIWDNECPKGTMVTSPLRLAGRVRYVVIRDKNDKLGEWYTEKRNVYEDYKKLFPDIEEGKPRDIKGVTIYINSQRTGSEVESYIYDVYFSEN